MAIRLLIRMSYETLQIHMTLMAVWFSIIRTRKLKQDQRNKLIFKNFKQTTMIIDMQSQMEFDHQTILDNLQFQIRAANILRISYLVKVLSKFQQSRNNKMINQKKSNSHQNRHCQL